jgi:hypothetical protein
MARVAPKARKPLSADALLRLVHTGFDPIPDYRPADVDMALSDVFMSAFAMFALTAPALLAFDQERARGQCAHHLRDPAGPVRHLHARDT